MKTQEEIEQLAEMYTNKIMEVAYYNFPLVHSKETVSKVTTALLKEYVTRCQEDMTKREILPEDIWNKEKQDKVKEHILNATKNLTPEDKLETELASKRYKEEDMADKKYTLNDMKKACACGIDIACKEGENDFQPFEDLINLLNKQH